MNIQIGIVEDEKIYKNQLLDFLEQWSLEANCEVSYYVKNCSEAFLEQLPPHLDIIFLDIQLIGMTGLELARQLRSKNYNSELVFLTAFQEYVFYGYQVHALNYLLKPASFAEIKACMDLVCKNLKTEHYIYRKQQDVFKIPYCNILYFASSRHYVQIITLKQTYEQLESIKNILAYLPPQFLQCHRTTIINIQHVQCIEGKTITMTNGATIPISRTYMNSVRDEFIKSIL